MKLLYFCSMAFYTQVGKTGLTYNLRVVNKSVLLSHNLNGYFKLKNLRNNYQSELMATWPRSADSQVSQLSGFQQL